MARRNPSSGASTPAETKEPARYSIPWVKVRWWAIRIFGVAVLIGVGSFLGQKWAAGYEFREVALNGQKDVLDNLSKRVTLKVNTTSQTSLAGVVGLVLIVDDNDTNKGALIFDSQNVIPDRRPPAELLQVSPINKVLYDERVTSSLNAGGKYTTITADLKSNQAADIAIADELYIGFKDKSKIPYDKLREIKLQPGKEYYFIEGATVTSTSYRMYDEVTSKGVLDGAAFKANGKVYMSSNRTAYSVTLAVDVFNIRLLQSSVGGATQEEILRLYSQYVSGMMSSEQAVRLTSLLKEASIGGVSSLAQSNLELNPLR